jgi:hypothetical protein
MREVLFLNGNKGGFAVPSAKDIFESTMTFETLPVPEKIEGDQLMLDDGEEIENKDII